jgi:signal transduction histidine kinase
VLDAATVTTIAWFDLAIAALIALAILLLGQALVAYEVFTGKTLPRRGLLRFWRNAIVLAAGYALITAVSLTLQVRPIYIVLLSLALLAVSYALFSWRAYAERERQMVQLRPFVASQQLYERLLEQAQDPGTPGAGGRARPVGVTGSNDGQPNAAHGPDLPQSRGQATEGDGPSPTISASFQALCRDVLGARVAYLVPVGVWAPLAGPPLRYAEADAARPIPGGLSELRGVADRVAGREPIAFVIEPGEHGGAHLALPLWAEQPTRDTREAGRGLMGLLLLGDKSDGGLYAQEEIDIARAAGERLIDALASAEVARRLLLLQRERLAESHIADQRTRRVLHDEVLPQLHASLLNLHALRATPAGEAAASQTLELLSAAHRQLSDLLREMPSTPAPDVARLGLVDALRRLLAAELARAFDAVDWELAPEAEARAWALPPLAADVLYSAAREALRNAARHARRPEAPLRMTIRLAPAGTTGLELTLNDDGAGLDPHPGGSGDSTGQGLSLHSTLLAVVGGTLTVDGKPGAGTRVRLTLP